ncbi:MAG: flagellar biosynthetic protein FliO [Leptospiraceae bacterium]|nr:flagellar biosynthetic protein FliO [Leptospiraceae bacterium]MCP5499555.1 flagellar biosynthetic protein FliO [Leptospiraceae bacterium]
MRHKSLKKGTLFVIFFLCFGFSLLAESETERLNDLLKKELEPDKQESPVDKKETKDKNPKETKEINPVEERYKPKEEGSSLTWVLFKIILVFGFLSAVMYYALKFLSKSRIAGFPVKDSMQVLASLPLAPGKQLQIVDVEGILMVLGVADGSINLITEITSPEIKERIYMKRDEIQPVEENFLEILLKNLKTGIKLPAEAKVDETPVVKREEGFRVKEEPETVDFYSRSEAQSEEDVVNEIKQRQLDRLEKLKKERNQLEKKNKTPGK